MFSIVTTVVASVSIVLLIINLQLGVRNTSDTFTESLNYTSSDVESFDTQLAIYTVVAILTLFVCVCVLVVDFYLSHARLNGFQNGCCEGSVPTISVSDDIFWVYTIANSETV